MLASIYQTQDLQFIKLLHCRLRHMDITHVIVFYSVHSIGIAESAQDTLNTTVWENLELGKL